MVRLNTSDTGVLPAKLFNRSPSEIDVNHLSKEIFVMNQLIKQILRSYYSRVYKFNTDSSCPLCGKNQDDLIHFLIICPMLDVLRSKYLHMYNINFSSCIQPEILLENLLCFDSPLADSQPSKAET
ncbi:uncharacterized protein [Rhodnius prolixus]|uniref:uncharacterized protein n=1 Tax=Rhodnius prolixus TaxID=13249 RepID=UPI003D18A70C